MKKGKKPEIRKAGRDHISEGPEDLGEDLQGGF